MNSIATNINSLAIRKNLDSANNTLACSLQRMSSGLKLMCAKDDAAGAVIASKTNVQISGLKLARSNIQFGMSLLNSANGAFSDIQTTLTRLRDLSLQAANSTCDEEQKAALENESNQLVSELERIQQSSNFNGLSLFNSPPTEQKTSTNSTLQAPPLQPTPLNQKC